MKITKTYSILLGCLLVVGGCSSPESRYYLPEPVYQAGTADGPILFVDEATVAHYADRPQFVTRIDPGRVRFEEFDVWAEPVTDVITAYLVDALGNHFGRDNVLLTPPGRPFDPDWRVQVDVLRIDSSDKGEVVLDARWLLFRGADEEFAGTGRERFVENLPLAKDGEEAVDQQQTMLALGRMLDALADRIAATIGS